jgi:POT family proton-dependent oligopeptide transporter
VFWVANGIEVLERFAYNGIYFGFGIYMASPGHTRGLRAGSFPAT